MHSRIVRPYRQAGRSVLMAASTDNAQPPPPESGGTPCGGRDGGEGAVQNARAGAVVARREPDAQKSAVRVRVLAPE